MNYLKKLIIKTTSHFRNKMLIMSQDSSQCVLEDGGLTARDRVLANPDLLVIIFSPLDPATVRRLRLVNRCVVNQSLAEISLLSVTTSEFGSL